MQHIITFNRCPDSTLDFSSLKFFVYVSSESGSLPNPKVANLYLLSCMHLFWKGTAE